MKNALLILAALSMAACGAIERATPAQPDGGGDYVAPPSPVLMVLPGEIVHSGPYDPPPPH